MKKYKIPKDTWIYEVDSSYNTSDSALNRGHVSHTLEEDWYFEESDIVHVDQLSDTLACYLIRLPLFASKNIVVLRKAVEKI